MTVAVVVAVRSGSSTARILFVQALTHEPLVVAAAIALVYTVIIIELLSLKSTVMLSVISVSRYPI